MNYGRNFLIYGTGLALAASSIAPAVAASYPESCGVIKIEVPYSPGASADLSARLVADRLSASLNKSFVVENKPGASGNIGTAEVVAAPPDGCTLLLNATVIATFVYSFSKLGYDPYKDLIPVGSIGVTPTVVVVPASSKAKTVNDLIAFSKAKPDGLSYSIAGYGLQQHLVVEEMAQRSGAKFVYVPYKGAGGAGLTDLIAGRVDFASFLAATTTGFIHSGQIKALAVVQDKRSVLFPDLPSTAEQGFPGLFGGVHFMLFAPAGTPKPIVDKLGAELQKIVGDPKLKDRFITMGMEPIPMASQQLTAEMHTLGESMAPVIKRLDIKLN
jgi:tripartite-type tricarboxylate transporter receptor subunit TctC